MLLLDKCCYLDSKILPKSTILQNQTGVFVQNVFNWSHQYEFKMDLIDGFKWVDVATASMDNSNKAWPWPLFLGSKPRTMSSTILFINLLWAQWPSWAVFHVPTIWHIQHLTKRGCFILLSHNYINVFSNHYQYICSDLRSNTAINNLLPVQLHLYSFIVGTVLLL